jgi:TANFOR domain-containing protein
MITRKMFQGKLIRKAGLPGFRAILLLLVIFGCLAEFKAQPYPVMVTVAVTPPYPSKIDTYISQPNKIIATFLNISPEPADIYVLGSIQSESGINVYTDPGFRMSPPLTLLPGVPYTLNRFNLEEVFDEDHLECQGITLQEVINGNGLPEDDYTICLRAYNYQNGEPVSEESPLGCSNRFTVLDLEVPVLLTPPDGSEIEPVSPQNIIFSWTWPPGAPANTTFDLKIIEVLPADRNINDAFQSAAHPVFFETTVSVSSYLFGPSDPLLVEEKTYAWIVTAYDPSGQAVFRNDGESEVMWFVCKKEEDEK